TQLDDAAFCKQGHAVGGLQQALPVEGTVADYQFPFAETLLPTVTAQQVQCLHDQQGFVPGDPVERLQRVLQLATEPIGIDAHTATSPASAGCCCQSSYQGVDQFPSHFRLQQFHFCIAARDVGGVLEVAAFHTDHLWWQQ